MCNVEQEQSYNRIVPAGEGEAIVCWRDERNEDGLTYDIYAMKISGEDELVKQWEPEDGVSVVAEERNQQQVRMCPDGEGGAYFVWEDERNARVPETEIYAQRINSEGEVQWRDNGIPVCDLPGPQRAPVILKSSNGCIAAWQDQRSGSNAIFTQKLSPDGRAVWEEDGIALVDSIDGNAQNLKLLSKYDGTFVLSWLDGRRGQYGLVPYVQHCADSEGTMDYFFDSDGIPVAIDLIGGSVDPEAALDEDGNIFVVWEDHRVNQIFSIYAQKINEEGELLWGERGLRISEENNQFDQQRPKVCIDEDGGIYVVWESDTEERYVRLFMQHIDSEGNRLWEGDMLVTGYEMDEDLEAIIPDGEGGAVVLWLACNPRIEIVDDLWLARINAEGEHLWRGPNIQGISLCNTPYRQRNPVMVKHPEGFVVIGRMREIRRTIHYMTSTVSS